LCGLYIEIIIVVLTPSEQFFQLHHGGNKLHFDKMMRMMMMSTLY